MLDALAPSQVDEVISLLDRLAEVTKRRAAEKIALSPDEVIADPQRWQLTDYLYAPTRIVISGLISATPSHLQTFTGTAG